jgi:hypothetical protein
LRLWPSLSATLYRPVKMLRAEKGPPKEAGRKRTPSECRKVKSVAELATDSDLFSDAALSYLTTPRISCGPRRARATERGQRPVVPRTALTDGRGRPREAWIATGARWPGSLQRMVRRWSCMVHDGSISGENLNASAAMIRPYPLCSTKLGCSILDHASHAPHCARMHRPVSWAHREEISRGACSNTHQPQVQAQQGVHRHQDSGR